MRFPWVQGPARQASQVVTPVAIQVSRAVSPQKQPPFSVGLAREAWQLLGPAHRMALTRAVQQRLAEDHGLSFDPDAIRHHNIEKILVEDHDLTLAADDEDGEGFAGELDEFEDLSVLHAPPPVVLPVSDEVGPLTEPHVRHVSSPRDLVKFSHSPLITWLDLYSLYNSQFRDKITFDKPDPAQMIWINKGNAHEASYLDGLKENRFREHFPWLKDDQRLSIVEIPKMGDDEWENPASHESRYQSTMQAMREGHDVVFQGYMRSRDGSYYGFADFLVKVRNPPGVTSEFGDYHYEAWDTKLAKHEKLDYLIQLCTYTMCLEDMQGFRPQNFAIVNGEGELLPFRTDEYFSAFTQLKKMYEDYIERQSLRFASGQGRLPELSANFVEEDPEARDDAGLIRDWEDVPFIHKSKYYGAYTTLVQDRLREIDAMNFVAGITSSQIKALLKAGVITMTELSQITPATPEAGQTVFYRTASDGSRSELDVPLAPQTLVRLIEQARVQVESRGKDTPVFRLKPVSESNPHTGLALLPPASAQDVEIDFEWKPGSDGWVYLFTGVFKNPSSGQVERKTFWAYSKEEEQKAFEEFVSWIYARFRRDRNMHAFHFTAAEQTQLRTLSQKYGSRAREMAELTKNGVFVDLFPIVKQTAYVGTESYGLKALEPLYMPKREEEVTSALESVVVFENWLSGKDGNTVSESPTLKSIEDYCAVDCESVLHLRDYLYKQQRENDISYNPAELQPKKDLSDAELRLFRLKEDLVARGQSLSKTHGDPEFQRIFTLLSQVLDFHAREAKPVFWARKMRSEMSDAELVEDKATLGALTFIAGSGRNTFRRTLTQMAIDAFDESARVYAAPQAEQVKPKADAPLADDSLSRVTLVMDRSVGPKVNKRFNTAVYTFRCADPDEIHSLMASDREHDFVAETFAETEGAWARIESVSRETGEIKVKFNGVAVEQLKKRLPTTITLTTEHLDTNEFAFEFDPKQLTKLAEGDRCFLAGNLDVRCEITGIDYMAGRVTVKFGATALRHLGGSPPEKIALIPDEHVSTKTIEDAIQRVLEPLIPGPMGVAGTLPRALSNLLRKEGPKIRGHDGVILKEGEDKTRAISDAIKNLDGSSLFIQGPPGTGKTYQAVEAMLDMIEEARKSGRKIKIGISAQSHHSILNTMTMLEERARARGMDAVRQVKLGDGGGVFDREDLPDGVAYRDNVKSLKPNFFDDVEVVGGTAWAFSTATAKEPENNEQMAKQFDYIFVDDASLMSFANVIGMSQALTVKDGEEGKRDGSFVFMGDQNQLPQPTRAAHLGESGLSVMDFFLDGEDVIPPKKGVFLDETWRNHPDITDVVSGHMYNGKLRPHPDNERQKINLPKTKRPNHLIDKESGFVSVPVEHEGNLHTSQEEIDVISDIVRELSRRTFTDRNGKTRKITPEDIMVVSPYVLQTQRLKERLGRKARVGTVHKFQGRQAPVVIISMAASDINPSSPLMRFEFENRLLNVAMSRAQALVVIVGSPKLEQLRVRNPDQFRALNFYLRAIQAGRTGAQHDSHLHGSGDLGTPF